MEAIKFSAESLALVDEFISRYPEGKHKSAILPVLHLAQSEFDGWLSVPVMDYVASLLRIQPIEVYEVASFYSMFNFQPVGKYLIEVCQTGSCMLCGSEDIVAHLEKKLNIGVGGTSADGMFSLKVVECLGSCGTAPMLQCGADYHENLTTEKVDRLLDQWKAANVRSSYLKHQKISG